MSLWEGRASRDGYRQAAAAITNKWGLAPAHITASDVSAAYKAGLG